MARLLMPRYFIPILIALACVGAITLIDNDGQRAVAQKAEDAQRGKPSVVLIIMDEFPVDQMLRSDGKIDAVRYPNFAALAAGGTWFKNASTTYDSTTRAIPQVMDGRLARKSTTPDFVGHPNSVYTIFGRRGYRIVSSQEATSVCPPRYCKGARRKRPDILPLLQSGRRDRLNRFFAAIKPGKPTLYLKHVLLPHGPYMFLPSGKQTRRTFRDPLPGMNGPVGFGSRTLTEHNRQRLQLQIAFADREIGRMITRMKANGTYDPSLIAITADHGISFQVGVKDRRTATRSNIDEVAPVPLFIKAPGQRRGRTSSAYARTVDVVPTIADLLNFKMPYRADGRSAFSATVRKRRFVRMIRRGFNGTLTVSAKNMERRRRALVRDKVAKFGQGDFASLYTGIGPNRQLLGKLTAALKPAAQGSLRTQIANASDMRSVDPGSEVHATQVAGSLTGGKRGRGRDLAVAVNGRIEAVGQTFRLRGSSKESYALMVPESALKPGRNSVELFEVTDKGTKLQLIGKA